MINSGTALDTRTRVKSWIALGIVYLVWGSTYLAIRVGVGHLPPLLIMRLSSPRVADHASG